MTDQASAPAGAWGPPAGEYTPPAVDDNPAGASFAAAPTPRPEVAIGAAFAGGVLAAILLRRFGD